MALEVGREELSLWLEEQRTRVSTAERLPGAITSFLADFEGLDVRHQKAQLQAILLMCTGMNALNWSFGGSDSLSQSVSSLQLLYLRCHDGAASRPTLLNCACQQEPGCPSQGCTALGLGFRKHHYIPQSRAVL